MAVWHIVTGEYPSAIGGVADYTRGVARGLAGFDGPVHVWAPQSPRPFTQDDGVIVHAMPDHLGPASIAQMNSEIPQCPNARLLVQYVPHSMGARGANLGFCMWLSTLRGVHVDVMFHEVALALRLRPPLKHVALSSLQHAMAFVTARSASRIFVAVPAWEEKVRRYARRQTPIHWLPVPSNVPVTPGPAQTARIRNDSGPVRFLVGHFSTYGPMISELLRKAIVELLRRRGDVRVLLMGRNSDLFASALVSNEPWLGQRLHATGELEAGDLSAHIAACDLMLQPYPDGVSSRRTSTMAALAHGCPVVTTAGRATEVIWENSGAVALASPGEGSEVARLADRLIECESERRKMGEWSRALYDRAFDLRHTLSALRN